MLTDDYLQDVIESKDVKAALATGQNIGWAICDGALVVYDLDDPPPWFRFERDEEGNSPWTSQHPLELADG